MKLTETDFIVLDKLLEDSLAANIAVEIDRSRKYVNSRMPYLPDYDLVERVGPIENTGLCELTTKGELVYEHRGAYHDDNEDLEDFINDRLFDY